MCRDKCRFYFCLYIDLHNKSCGIKLRICEAGEQGKGYGEEALYGFSNYLFTTYQLHRIYVEILVGNILAKELYEKVGFKVIGIERDIWLDSQGIYRSGILIDLIRDDYLREKYNL